MSYKDPSFQDRVKTAAEAKKKALEQLRAKPPVDPAILAERAERRAAREAAEEEKRAAKRAAIEQERAAIEQEKADKVAAAAAEAEAKRIKVPTAAELKAARDARYAARKARR